MPDSITECSEGILPATLQHTPCPHRAMWSASPSSTQTRCCRGKVDARCVSESLWTGRWGWTAQGGGGGAGTRSSPGSSQSSGARSQLHFCSLSLSSHNPRGNPTLAQGFSVDVRAGWASPSSYQSTKPASSLYSALAGAVKTATASAVAAAARSPPIVPTTASLAEPTLVFKLFSRLTVLCV
jgi:hypothetical protein